MNKYKSILITTLIILVSCILTTCKYEKATPDYQCFPTDVGKIIFTRCAVSGCHNDASKAGAGGLSLTSWDNMFAGGSSGAEVIPYRPDYSTLCFYINSYSDLGVTLAPTMPFNNTPLSHAEVQTIEKWVSAGAPCSDGAIKFADNPNRKKFYLTNQGCGVVTVFDAATLLAMRYINVGGAPPNSLPAIAHNVKVSPDGRYWYVICTNTNYLQKFSTATDQLVGQAYLGSVQRLWNTITISNNGDTAYVVAWDIPSAILQVDLNTFTIIGEGVGGLNYPHGSCLNPSETYLYVTQNAQGSNQIYKIPTNASPFPSNIQSINLFNGAATAADTLNTHEILFSPDGTKYFVTCQQSNQVRVLQASNDSLLAIISVGKTPQEMAVSAAHNLLFVTCQDDVTTFPGLDGSVAVIDIASNTFIKTIYTGHQPHGICLDDATNIAMVANRNITGNGPAPHHTNTGCVGRDGYVEFIDMSTLNVVQQGNIPKQFEVAVDPYSAAARH